MRVTNMTDADVDELIKAAREAAEDYMHIYIARGTITDDDGVVTTVGYTAATCPASIKQALYLYCVATHEKSTDPGWLRAFRDLLYPRREVDVS